MIVVDFYPVGERSPFPDQNASQWSFATHEEFKEWVQNYVCNHCLLDFYEFTGVSPKTLGDWLEMGCGFEIGVTDDHHLINWKDEMKLPDSYYEELKAYEAMKSIFGEKE